MAHPSPPGNIEAHVEGEISGQVAVGNYILQIGSVHGGVVNVASPGQQPRLRMRPTPVILRPRPFSGFLDREGDVSIAYTALRSALPAEFYGEAGLGKTTLLRHLAHQPLDATFPDGIVYLSARGQPLEDLLQSLVDAFYESDAPVKLTDAQARHALLNRQALILLDDVDLTRDAVEILLDVAPRCAFLMASQERRLWGEGRPIALVGLPEDEATALVERELGRPLTPEEGPAAQSLCTALNGHPLRILQAVAIARTEGRSIAEMARRMQAPSPVQELTTQIMESLSEPQQQILAALAALGGAPVSIDNLVALTGLPNVTPVLETLQQGGLVQTSSPRYGLAGDLEQDLRQRWDLTPLAEQALTHFTNWAEAGRHTPERLLAEIDAILWVMEWGSKAGRWQEVLRLGWAVESALVLNGRWEVWKQVLNLILRGARVLGNRAAEAWALHQLGSQSLCLGDPATARTSLGEALRVREALGERVGAMVTRHNLELLTGPPPPPQPPSETRPTRPSGGPPAQGMLWLIGGVVAVFAVLALVVGGLVAARLLRSTPTPPPPITVVISTPTSTVAPSHTPTPTARSTSISTSTPSPSYTLMPTSTPTYTPTPTSTPTRSPTPTPTIPPDTEGPTLSKITESDDPIYWPPYCAPNEVTIGALVSDPSGVSGVKLAYRVVQGSKKGSWQALPMKQAGTNAYAATVGSEALRASLDPPSAGAPATLEYTIQAFDGIGNRSESPTGTLRVEYCLY